MIDNFKNWLFYKLCGKDIEKIEKQQEIFLQNLQFKLDESLEEIKIKLNS